MDLSKIDSWPCRCRDPWMLFARPWNWWCIDILDLRQSWPLSSVRHLKRRSYAQSAVISMQYFLVCLSSTCQRLYVPNTASMIWGRMSTKNEWSRSASPPLAAPDLPDSTQHHFHIAQLSYSLIESQRWSMPTVHLELFKTVVSRRKDRSHI